MENKFTIFKTQTYQFMKYIKSVLELTSLEREFRYDSVTEY